MFDMIFDFVRGKKRAPPQINSAEHERASRRRELAAKFGSELAELRETITDKNVKPKAHEFYALVKEAFKESLSLKYEATFQEIQEEINNHRHYSGTFRDEVDGFLDDVAMMEYGYDEFKKIVEDKRHLQEKQLHVYIAEMEKEGDHLHAQTKKKITQIVSENLPASDREFLIRMVDRFKPMLHQII